MARQLTPDQQFAELIKKIAEEEDWLDKYHQRGIYAPKQEEVVYNLRQELASLREKAGLRS